MKCKKGTMSTDQILRLILAIAAVSILLLLVGKLLFSTQSQPEKASDSYFEAFMREIEAADEGYVGEFSMWQDERDRGKFSVFLVYFGDKFKYEVSFSYDYKVTFITYGRENMVCVCFWDGEEAVCKKENCDNLKYPMKAELLGYSAPVNTEGQWVIGDKQSISIEKVEEEYIVTETTEFDTSFDPVRLREIRAGDILEDENGRRCEVISSGFVNTGGRGGTGTWMIKSYDLSQGEESECGAIYGSGDIILGKDFDGIEYRLYESNPSGIEDLAISDLRPGDILVNKNDEVRCEVFSSGAVPRDTTGLWMVTLRSANSGEQESCTSVATHGSTLLEDWSGGKYRLED